MTKNTGIPTTYKGVQFRSRLEARWACFFDLCGWVWEYEPIDMPGWIPDFRLWLRSSPKQCLLVEVKPHQSLDPETCEKIHRACPVPSSESVDRGCEAVLILGSAPRPAPHAECLREIGWSDRAGDWTEVVAWFDHEKWEIAISLSIQGQICRETIFPEFSDRHFIHFKNVSVIDSLWVEAGNRVQWKGVQNRG